MRAQIASTVNELFERDERVAVVLAEISSDLFRPARRLDPSRALNVGIMEATMVGVAAGFALEVKERRGALVEVNLYESEITRYCDHSLRGGAANVLPRLVKAISEKRSGPGAWMST